MNMIKRLLGEENAKEVDKNEKSIQEEQTVNADFLGSCLALAVYDPQQKEAYLSHFPTIGNEKLETQLEDYISEVKDKTEPPYEVFLGGTMNPNANPLEEEYTIKQARETAEELAENHFQNQYTCDWSNDITRSRVIVHPQYGIIYEETVPEHQEQPTETSTTFQKYMQTL